MATPLAPLGPHRVLRLRAGRALFVAGLSLMVAAWPAWLGCSPSTPTPAQQAEVGAYEAAMLACVAKAPTRYDADACRAGVRAAFEAGVPADGGGQ